MDRKKMAAKMGDSDSLKEYSRTNPEGKRLYRMPEGLYKATKGRYYKQRTRPQSIIHG